MDNNLQYHINGGYLRNYLQIAHAGWTTKVWDNIDMEAFSRHLKKLTTPHKTTHLKFIHNLQPLGVNNFRRAKVQDPNLKRCPCCKDADENQHHLIGCKENPLRKDALATLLKTITSDDAHPFGITLAICIEKVAEDTEAHIAAPLGKQHQRFHAYIQDAINDQASIVGWFHMLRGFMSTSWHVLAAINTANSKTLDHPRGHHKIQSVLKAFHKFTRDTMWLGRNEALHKEKDIADSQIYSDESAELRHYHSDPKLLKQQDQHYCNISLTKLLTSKPSVRRRWLRRVRTVRALYIREGQSQQVMTRYLPYTPAPKHTHIQGLQPQQPNNQARTTTTQQLLTAYFTGRPPDAMRTEPGNPSHARS